MKRRGNRRYYQHHEVLMIRRIRDLLYDQGFTITGARNKLQELIGVEAKRVIEIVGKKSLKDSEQSIQDFYSKWKVTLANAETGIDVDQYVADRLTEIGALASASKTVTEFRQSINNQLAKWSADNVL
jgi:DNA-binding transcriptional MerR regulator